MGEASGDDENGPMQWFKDEDADEATPFQFGTANERPSHPTPVVEFSTAESSVVTPPPPDTGQHHAFAAAATLTDAQQNSSGSASGSTGTAPVSTVADLGQRTAAPSDIEVIDPSLNDATRRMSAACYYDQRAMRQVLDLVGSRNFGFIARHDGVDTNIVVSHAAAAFKRWRRHNWITVGATALTAYLAVLSQNEISPAWSVENDVFASTTQTEIGPLWAIPVTFAVFVYLVIGIAIARLLTAMSGLSRHGMGRTVVVSALVLGWLFAMGQLAFAAIYVMAFATELAQRVHLHGHTLAKFRRGRWTGKGGEPPASLRPLVDGLGSPAKASNLTVYSGYRPFVAAGFLTDEWNSALELRPASGGLAIEVDGPAFLAEMSRYFATLELQRTSVRRWYFVDGEGASQVPELFAQGTSRPASFVPPQVLEGHDDELVRPYLWLTSDLWRGGLILNSFIRFDVRSKTLFVEMAHAVVPPLRKEYEVCDVELSRQGRLGYSYLTRSALDGLVQIGPLMLWRATRRRRWRRSNREAKARHAILDSVDHGARGSVRDIFAGTDYRHYFQSMDADRMQKTINVQLLNGLAESLEAHGYEIAQLDELASSIVTNNITNVVGSNIQGKDISVGSANKLSNVVSEAKKK